MHENEEEPKLFQPKAYLAHSTYKALQIYLKSNTEQWDLNYSGDSKYIHRFQNHSETPKNFHEISSTVD